MKRLLTSTAMLLCSLLSFAQFIGTVTDSQGVKYTANNDESTCYVSGHEDTYSSEIVIPEVVQGRVVTKIKVNAFHGCSSLTSITIPNSVTRIGAYAFSRCTGLTSVEIPSSVTSIGIPAFSGCSSLTSIVVESGNTVYDSRENCNAIIYTSDNTLIAGCNNTQIPNSVTSIGAEAFDGCSSLTSLTLPNSVTSIGDRAFEECSGLTSITIPNSVTSIGNYILRGCNSLIEVISEIQDPFEIAEIVFEGVYTTARLKVPDGSKSKYQATNYWNKFTLIIETSEQLVQFSGTVSDSQGVKYTADNNGVSCYVSGHEDNYSSEIVIPEVFQGRVVTQLKTYYYGCFSGCSDLKSITIPNSVTSIDRTVFSGCSGLTSITIPSSVTSIGIPAFSGCSSLTSIVVESGNTVYDSRENCNAIIYTSDNTLIAGCNNTQIPNSVTSIGESAFYGCSCLSSVTIPNSVTSLGNSAFEGCSGLTSMTIPNSVTSIGAEAFRDCTGLTSITIPSSVTSIDNSVFSGCSGLTSITIPNSVTSIGAYAFYCCKGLTSVEIPNSVTSIGDGTFQVCTGLTSVIIPNSVTSIGAYAFRDCTGLTSVTIPNSVTSIGGWAFYGCSSLTSIIIPNSVTTIGYCGFASSGLTSITIPNSVTSIGELAFNHCENLTDVISEIQNPFEISENVFTGAYTTAKLTVPQGTKSKYEATNYWNKFTNIVEASEQTEPFSGTVTDSQGVKYTANDDESTCYVSGHEDTYSSEIVIPEVVQGRTVTSIGDYAFGSCSSLTSITIPNSVTSIGNYAFIYCFDLTSVTIPNGVTSIGKQAFCACSHLTSITIPNSVTSIGGGAFEDCDSLTSVTIPNSVMSIGELAFTGCIGLTSITIENGNTIYDSRENCNAIIKTSTNELIAGCKNTVIPNSVTSIARYAFWGCRNLTSITIPNSVTSIGNTAFKGCTGLTSINIPGSVTSISDHVFDGCSGLTSVTIGNNVTSIGIQAFRGCIGLSSVTIPNSVTRIGSNAYGGCSSLLDVISEIQNPFEIAENVFEGAYTTAKLTVPQGTIEKYQATNYWNLFANIVEKDLPPVDDGETVDFGDDIDEDTNLDGNVVGNIYFNISSDDGGYNSAEGCIVVNKPTDDSSVDGQDIFGEDFHDNFTGIVFKVPAGSGTVKVEAQTTGSMVLKVKIGNNEPVSMELDGKLKASFPYNVTEPTFVYIYAGSNGSSAPGLFGNSANNGELKIYGIEVDTNATGITDVNVNDNSRWYSLDGQQLQGKPTQKGVYIVNGRKVVIK